MTPKSTPHARSPVDAAALSGSGRPAHHSSPHDILGPHPYDEAA